MRRTVWIVAASLALIGLGTGCEKDDGVTGPESGSVVATDLVLSSQPMSLPADGASQARLSALVLGENSNPVRDGTPVTFELATGGGQIVGARASTVEGVAEAIYVAGTAAGPVGISATSGSARASVPLVLTPLDAAGLFLAVDDSTVLADGLASAMIIAVVTDVFGHPVAPGTDVNFVTTRGVLLDILPTDSTGVASARLRSERFDTGTARVTVSASGFHQAIDVQFVSEEAAHIEVVSVDPTQIGVVGTGQPEVSTITFEVRDANGIPVDAGHAATLAFEVFSTGETTDATIHPASAVTGQEGRAIATVNAGTISGVVQIQASTGEVNARPIAVAIHSGLPDPLHFSLAFEKVNVAGLVYSGLSDGVTAFVGDKHGNPVSEGTMVWFHTSGGIVGPSAATNAMGTATVTSLTAEPRPGSDGLVAICAKTVPAPEYVAQYGDTVEVCGNVLWSGATTIEVVSPSVLDVPNGGSVPVRFRVADDNGNPLTEGTTISVETTAGELFGQTDVTLPDTQSPDLTVFEVLLSDDDPGTVQTRSIWLTISVVSQNGDAAIFYPGTIH